MANNAAYAQVTARPSDRCAGRGRRPERTSTAARYWQSPLDLFQVQPSSDNLIVSDLEQRHPAHLKRLPVAAGARQRHSVKVVSPSWTDEDTIGLIWRLAVHYPDAGIAGILNRQGRRTARGLSYTASRVQSLRYHWHIPCHQPSDQTPEGDLLNVTAARQLKIAPSTLLRWLNDGFIAGE